MRFPPVPLIAFGSLFLAACAGTPKTESTPLPMRLAILPIESVGQRERVAGEELDETDMVLQLAGRAYAEAVVRALDGRLFARAFLLERPTGAEPENEIDWAELAEEQGADAILALQLAGDPRILEASNSGYYLNFLLFAIGGPFCWWLPDHTYDIEAKLSAELYDLPRLRREKAQPGSEAAGLARISDASAPSEQTEMSFTNRVEGDVGQYALSIVWPAPLLMADNDELRDNIERQTMDALAARLAADMQADREFIVEAPFLAPFHLDADAASANADGTGVHLRAQILVQAESRVEELKSVRVQWASTWHEAQPREVAPRATGDRRYRVFAIEWDGVDAPEDRGFLNLRIEAETPALFARTYTLPVARKSAAPGE